MNKFKMRILGGLPVTIDYSFNKDLELQKWSIVEVNGKELKRPPKWLYDRIDETEGQEDKIINQCYSHFQLEQP